MSKMRKKFKNVIASLLAVVLVLGLAPAQLFAVNFSEQAGIVLTDEQISALAYIQEHNALGGLVGFEGDYALPNDGTMVNVIVYFERETAAVQVLTAALYGDFLATEEAEQNVEDDHARFRSEVSQLFAASPMARMGGGGYNINHMFHYTLNGVSMTLPANMVAAVAALPSVRLIQPDFIVHLDLVDENPWAEAEMPVQEEESVITYPPEEDDYGYNGDEEYNNEEEDYPYITEEGDDVANLQIDNETFPVVAASAPLLGWGVFNNGNSNNQSLAGLGVIRMWAQLDRVNTHIPYAALEITPTIYPTGECALEFFRINRIWDNLDYVSLIDVRKRDANWERIIFSSSLNGVPAVDILLINDLYGLVTATPDYAEGSGTITAERRTITINLTEGIFADDISGQNFIISANLGNIEQVHRMSDTEVRIVVQNHASEGGFYSITANDDAFAGDYVGFEDPIILRVFDVPYRGHDSGRYRMNVADLHERGYDGTGVLVAVVDSGLDWMHPAFRYTFPTAADMAARGVTISQDEMINLGTDENPDWRFVGRDMARTWPGANQNTGAQAWRGNPTHLPLLWPEGHPLEGTVRPGHSPMELAPFNFLPEFRNVHNNNVTTFPLPAGTAIPAWSNHGTHVHGSVNSNPHAAHGDVGLLDFDVVSVGVAPGAMGIHYRISFGGASASVMFGAFEQAARDGADVITMSFGSAIAVQSLYMANYTRLSLAFPNIVLVTSAGNTGPQHATQGSPGHSAGFLSVAAFSEPAEGVYLQTPVTMPNVMAKFMTPPTRNAMDDTTIPGRVTFNTPLTSTNINNVDTGEFRLFALPNSGAAAVVNLGVGNAADFQLLVQQQGALALAREGVDQPTQEQIEEAGRAEIEGHFVLLRRGYGLMDTGANALAFGMAGLFQIGNPGQTFNSSGFRAVPMFSINHEQGLPFADAMLALNGETTTFYLSERMSIIDGPFVVDFSARGHTLQSYELKPEIGANGVAVLSTIPRWTARLPWQDVENGIHYSEMWQDPAGFIGAYGYSQGTSMSAPHVAGGVAIMVQYSQQHNLGWTSEEIRTRILNNADQLTYYSIFDMPYEYSAFAGARQMNVQAAIEATTVVSVGQPHFFHTTGVPFRLQPHERDLQMGHFSFGGIGPGGERTLTATIASQTGGTYYISHEFRGNTRMAAPAQYRGTLTHPSTVTVAPGGVVEFDATIAIPANAPTNFYASGATGAGALNNVLGGNQPPRLAGAWAGDNYHDGYMTVRRGGPNGEIAAILPFGAVAIPRVEGEAIAMVNNVIRITLDQMPARPGIGVLNPFDPHFLGGTAGTTTQAISIAALQDLDNNIFTLGGDDVADLGEIMQIVRINNTTVDIIVSGHMRFGGDYTIHATDAAFSDFHVVPITGGSGFTAHNSRALAYATFAEPLQVGIAGAVEIVSVTPQRVVAEPGDTVEFEVEIARHGFEGPVSLLFSDYPVTVPANATAGVVSITVP
ncbi:MAG: S8 family serine peptidase, partial [Defluviitaleaceae bacterium]|nr:S8 family serine peptidase [Defluviitaleaceae bacterium]